MTALGACLEGGLLVGLQDRERHRVLIERWTFPEWQEPPEHSNLVPSERQSLLSLEVPEGEQVRFLLPNFGRPSEAFVVFWRSKVVHALDMRRGVLRSVLDPRPAQAGGTELEQALRDHRLNERKAIDHAELGYVYLLTVAPFYDDDRPWGVALVDADRDGDLDLSPSYALRGREAWEPFASSKVYRALW